MLSKCPCLVNDSTFRISEVELARRHILGAPEGTFHIMRLSESKESLLGEESYDCSSERSARSYAKTCEDCKRRATTAIVFRVYVYTLQILVIVMALLYLYLLRDRETRSPEYKSIGMFIDAYSSLFSCWAHEPAPILDSLAKIRTDEQKSPHTSLSIYAGSLTKESNQAWDDLIQRSLLRCH